MPIKSGTGAVPASQRGRRRLGGTPSALNIGQPIGLPSAGQY